MIQVYFKIFGTPLIKQLEEEEFDFMTDEQIENYVLGKGRLDIMKIKREEIKQETFGSDDTLDQLKNMFGME